MADMLRFVVTVPEESTGDVVTREIMVTLPDGSTQSGAVAGRLAGDSGEFSAAQDSIVKVSVVNVDDAGNRSEAREQEFTVVDTIAPPEPGEVGIKVVGETTTP